MAPDSTNVTRPTVATGSETLSPPTDRLPNEMSSPMPPAADRRAGISPAENALRDVDEAGTTTTNATRSTVATGSETLSPPRGRLPSEMSTPMPPTADRRAGMSPAEDALHDTDEAVMTTTNTTQSTITTGSEILLPPSPTDRLSSEMSTPMPPAADVRAGMSPAENALHDADEAMTTMNLSNTLEGALERIKWVLDAVSSVAEVRAMYFLPILH